MRDYNRDMGQGVDYETFKQSQLGEGSACRLLLKPIADVCELFLRDCHSTMLQVLLTCLDFPCRMTLCHLPSLLEKEKKVYKDLEAEMRTWEYPVPLVEELAAEIRSLFLDWPGFSFWPRHGGGSVSDVMGRDATVKYHRLLTVGLPPRLHHYFAQHGIHHPLVNMKTTDLGTSCRVLLVPKGVSSKRVISSEPTANQWFQQALRRDLADYLPKSSFRITMEDQTRNQELAQVGSLFRNYGTIDLSSASDTVTYPLVKSLFEGTPIWDELWSSRSSYALLDDERLPLAKFAPMGSAVCFPLECIVFAAVVRVAQKHVGVHHDYVVYGDDIICHSSVFGETVRLLGQLHFRVNEKKTFWPESPFKESCGKEYYYGDDVTPFRIPRFFQGWETRGQIRKSPSILAGWISLANRLGGCGLISARSYLVKRLLELCPNVLFSETDEYLALKSNYADNYHLRSRWECETSTVSKSKKNLCRGRLVRGVSLITKPSPGDDDVRYQMLLESYIHTTRLALQMPDDLIQLEAGPTQLAAKDRWVAERDLMIRHCGGNQSGLQSSNRLAATRESGFDFVFDSGAALPEWRLRNVL
jgi:hypothetical protein